MSPPIYCNSLPFPTREAWLVAATEKLRSGLFAEQGAVVPPVRLSVGFPGGGSTTAIGQIWLSRACADAIPQVFISPVIAEATRALDILVHELVHAVHPTAGHGPVFKRLAVAVGLTGRMTATVASEPLKVRLNALADELGPYPHSEIMVGMRRAPKGPGEPGEGEPEGPIGGPKKQGTRMLKVQCSRCGYTARVAGRWIREYGAPICPCNQEPMSEGDTSEEE